MEERLIKFARIVEAGSFTRAATELHISQPALTTAVKKLERELQAELLVRGNRRLTLTAAGTIAYQTAQSLRAETKNLTTQIRTVARQKAVLNIGMIDSLANLLFLEATYLDELDQNAHVSLAIDNSSRLIEQVRHNDLDVALVARPQQLAASLHFEHIGQEPLVLVAPAALQPLLKKEIRDKRLRHFLSYNQASHTYHIVSGHAAQAGIALEPAFYSTSPEIMLRLALAGRGGAVLPYLLVKPYLADGTLQPIDIVGSPVIRRSIIGIRHAARIASPQSSLLLTYAAYELQKLDREASNL